jgi:Flp pilus assembly protein TadG
MVQSNERNNCRGILARLLRDQTGNTIAIMAAAVIPTIGLIGGAVDISRIYLARTKLQAACDAGSLMGRKVMGVGDWNTLSNQRAEEMFNHNFASGAYGTQGLTKSYTESAGNVTGIASVGVPVTLMNPVLAKSDEKTILKTLTDSFVATAGRQPSAAELAVLRSQAETLASTANRSVTVSVTCESQMAIPNSDVMFVLDVTGSMNSGGKLDGLKTATKCFYEALQKENITSVSAAACGQADDPNGGNSADVSIRFGFVPYAVNVNVGKLLPLDYIANNWTYQSREPVWTLGSGWTPVYGTESTRSPTGTPTTTSSNSWPDDWDNSATLVIGSTTYDSVFSSSESECDDADVPPNQTRNFDEGIVETSRSPATPVYPTTTSQTINYRQKTGVVETRYRYRWSSRRSGGRCRLEYDDRTLSSSTSYFTSTVPITWERQKIFDSYNYKPVTFNVSGLKDTTRNAWRNSVSLPVGDNGANITADWEGCIEERQTLRFPNTNPALSSWTPIPAGANDMNIDMAPSTTDAATQWGPMLTNVVYRRYWNGSATTSTVNSDSWETSANLPSVVCPEPAKLYQQWTPTAFDGYVNSLTGNGNTYHDIGLLWGARLMSPTGIFGSHNRLGGRDIQRHMIFMTDGDTVADPTNYAAHGIHWWDRRQNDGSAGPDIDWLEANIDARSQAICSWVKAQNISLWVVGYGTGISATTEANLTACASPGKYFKAADAAALNAQFRNIAADISNLRLTS